MPMLSPMTKTMACSSMVRGLVRKKKARVRWKREMEVMMVLAAMSGMAGRFCLCHCLYLFFFSLSLSRTVYIYDSWTGEVERRAGSESCRWGGFFVVSRV